MNSKKSSKSGLVARHTEKCLDRTQTMDISYDEYSSLMSNVSKTNYEYRASIENRSQPGDHYRRNRIR